MNLQSTIKAVTVYSDRAQITRSSKISELYGEQELIFDNLPATIDSESIQINTKAKLILKDIKYEKTYLEQSNNKQFLQLTNEIETLNDQLIEIQDTISLDESEKEFANQIVQKITSSDNKKGETELNPDSWAKMMDFYRKKVEQLNESIRKNTIQFRKFNKKKEHLELQKQNFDKNTYIENHQVRLVVDISEKKEFELEVLYLVHGPSWTPTYDVRVDSQNKMVSFGYNAFITQNSGEDWEDVQLTLSTARAYVKGNAPKLVPWSLDIYVPLPPPMARKKKSKGAMHEMAKMSRTRGIMDEVAEAAPMAESPKVAVKTEGTAAVFVILSKNTILANKQSHKVGIGIHQLQSAFEYATVPKLSTFVYLKAKITNNTEFAFLAGKSNIFLDGNFVSSSQMKLVQPSENFSLALGIDEMFTVERKLIDKHSKGEGLFSKKRTKIVYEYSLEIKNNKQTDEELVLEDQIPKSRNEDIEVHLLEPKIKDNSDSLSRSEMDYLTWKFPIKAGEKKLIELKYSVEYSKTNTISGLE